MNGGVERATRLSIFATDAPLPRSPLALALSSNCGGRGQRGGAGAKRGGEGKGKGGGGHKQRGGGRGGDLPVMFHRKVTSSGYGSAPVMALHAGGPTATKARPPAPRGGAVRVYTPAKGPICHAQLENNRSAPHLHAPGVRLAFAPDASRRERCS